MNGSGLTVMGLVEALVLCVVVVCVVFAIIGMMLGG